MLRNAPYRSHSGSTGNDSGIFFYCGVVGPEMKLVGRDIIGGGQGFVKAIELESLEDFGED